MIEPKKIGVTPEGADGILLMAQLKRAHEACQAQKKMLDSARNTFEFERETMNIRYSHYNEIHAKLLKLIHGDEYH